MKTRFTKWLVLVCALALLCTPLSVSARMACGGQASSGGIKAYGCDLSFWNVGGYTPDYSLVDFEKMKADGCDFVILRLGFEGTSTRENALDSAFLTLYDAAKQAGLGVGVYFYALATTYDGAAEDAAWCIDLFKQYDLSFEYPIYYDVEDPGNGADRPGHYALTAAETTQLCLGWAKTLEAAGYYPGTYGTYDMLTKLQPAYTAHYDVWYAYVAYEEDTPEFIPEEQDHTAFCGMWQYSWEGSFAGATGNIDVNVAYKDYPSIMRANGYNNIDPVWSASASLLPTEYSLTRYPYNEAGEGVVPTYHGDGTVTLTTDVQSSWAWPSAYAACYREIDLTATPYLTVNKYGTSNFNATLAYAGADGTFRTVTLATLADETNGEFGGGAVTVEADVATYLKAAGQYPSDGVLKVYGVTYYVMGATGAYTTLTQAAFTAAPYMSELTSSVYTVSTDMVSRVPAPCTAASLLGGFDRADGVAVYGADGTRLAASDTVVSGMSVAIEYNGMTVKRYTLSLIGDVNADGEASTVDARLILASFLGGETLSAWQSLSADFDNSGTANTADVRELLCSVLA